MRAPLATTLFLILAVAAMTLRGPAVADGSSTQVPTPDSTAAPNAIYFLALRLADQRKPPDDEQPVDDNLAKHLRKLKENTSPKDVFVYEKRDFHISIQLLTQTAPLSTTDQAKLDKAMAAVKAEYAETSLDICGPIRSGKFHLQQDGYIVYRMADDGPLTGLMQSVRAALDAQKFSYDQRQDFPGRGHYSVGVFNTKKSTLFSDLNTQFKPWAGQKDTKTVHYMRPPYCTAFVALKLSLLIREKNPAGAPALEKHYRVEKSYPLR